MSVLGQNIKQIRMSKNLTQKELSILSKVSQSTIAEIEKGTRQNLRGDNLTKISAALEVPINELLGIVEEKEYELTNIEEAIKIIFQPNSKLELDSIRLDSFELELIHINIQSAINSIRLYRNNLNNKDKK